MERFRTYRLATTSLPQNASEVEALASLAMDLNAGGEAQLTPAGAFRGLDGRPTEVSAWRIDAAIAQRLMARFNARAKRTVIDYEHQTLHAEKNGQPAPAAGWFGKLEWRDGQGLFSVGTEWNARAKAMIEAKEYRYISPVFAYSTRTGEVLDIFHAALTNAPALGGMAEVALRAAERFEAGDPVAAAKAEYEGNAALREEFIDLPTYAAWRKASAEGRVKVFGHAIRRG
jgi:phage I-like protein